MIPGSNILSKALRTIRPQCVTYHRYIGQAVDDAGIVTLQYAAARPIKGSWQPVPRSLYQSLGLDFNKIYVNFYCPKVDILDIQRDVGSDQITFQDERYQVNSATDWSAIDGWVAVLCVQIGAASAR